VSDPFPFGLLTLIVSLEALANHLGLDVNQVYVTAHDRINQAPGPGGCGPSRHGTGLDWTPRRRDHTGAATRCRTRPMAALTRNAAAISITP
jgi:hypothetical protein